MSCPPGARYDRPDAPLVRALCVFEHPVGGPVGGHYSQLHGQKRESEKGSDTEPVSAHGFALDC